MTLWVRSDEHGDGTVLLHATPSVHFALRSKMSLVRELVLVSLCFVSLDLNHESAATMIVMFFDFPRKKSTCKESTFQYSLFHLYEHVYDLSSR